MLVLADYFLGFATREVSGGARPWRLYYTDEPARRVSPSCDTAFSGDLYVNGDVKDIASTYYPAIGPYDTTDPDVAEYHVLLAKAAGIDGFMSEFTLGQEANLLCLVKAAKRYDFRIGVNWISQSHFGENTWRDRAEAMAKAHELVRWMAEHVYRPCGVRGVDGRYLFLIFLAHPREPAAPFDPFFSPAEVRALKRTAADAGCDANFLVLPWEPLAEHSAGAERAPVWDGYFPWVWSSSGSAQSSEGRWTHVTTRAQYLERLEKYYTTSRRLRDAGRIGTYIGAVCPGFDDHKGQAWGEGYKRYLPRDGGKTLADTWSAAAVAGVNTVLVITWNDWVESSQIEPSLELGDSELLASARHVATWKGGTVDERLIQLPRRLLDARRAAKLLRRCGFGDAELAAISSQLDAAAAAIATRRPDDAAAMLDTADHELRLVQRLMHVHDLHLLWEAGFVAGGMDQVSTDKARECGFALDIGVRARLRGGHFTGRLNFEFLDAGRDFIEVRVDAADERHATIASFRSTNTGAWRSVSMDLVNARFVGGLRGADLLIRRTGGAQLELRRVRVDGVIRRARPA